MAGRCAAALPARAAPDALGRADRVVVILHAFSPQLAAFVGS